MRLLLHSCCAPCSSSVLEQLINGGQFDEITVYYYNPNIFPESEYIKRKNEQIRMLNLLYPNVKILDCDYERDKYLCAVKGFEQEKEGGARCDICYRLRMKETALKAKELGYDYFGTTLSVSPYKNAEHLNFIGQDLESQIGVKYFVSNFKKKNGYLRSIQLSKTYNLYRQNYCGCPYSMPKDNE